MKTKLITIAALFATLSVAAHADSFGKPCTSEPKERWLSLEAIEKIVRDHGYEVAKSKIKNACAEVYARDSAGTRVELFIDPATGNPAGAEWKSKTN